jgi:hypothetical protein
VSARGRERHELHVFLQKINRWSLHLWSDDHSRALNLILSESLNLLDFFKTCVGRKDSASNYSVSWNPAISFSGVFFFSFFLNC